MDWFIHSLLYVNFITFVSSCFLYVWYCGRNFIHRCIESRFWMHDRPSSWHGSNFNTAWAASISHAAFFLPSFAVFSNRKFYRILKERRYFCWLKKGDTPADHDSIIHVTPIMHKRREFWTRDWILSTHQKNLNNLLREFFLKESSIVCSPLFAVTNTVAKDFLCEVRE